MSNEKCPCLHCQDPERAKKLLELLPDELHQDNKHELVRILAFAIGTYGMPIEKSEEILDDVYQLLMTRERGMGFEVFTIDLEELDRLNESSLAEALLQALAGGRPRKPKHHS